MSTATPLVETNRSRLEAVCREHRVRHLYLFGSATTDRFDENLSDLDFLVSFEHMPPGKIADAYFGLLEDLEEIFERRVELVTNISAQKNPYFLHSVERSKVPVYGT